MKHKHLLLAAASVAALVAQAGPAAAQSAINIDQYLPDLFYSPQNDQYVNSNRGDASLTGLNQAISNVANEIQTNLPGSSADLSISQRALVDSPFRFASEQRGNNVGDVIANGVGDAVLSGAQVFENSLNTLNIPGLASGASAVNVSFGQQYDLASGGSPITAEIHQYTDNSLNASGGTGNASISADQIGQNTRNIATIAANALDTVTGYQVFGESANEQANNNTADSATDIGNATFEGVQQSFNTANAISVTADAVNVSLDQDASADNNIGVLQTGDNRINATVNDVGNALVSVDQTAVSRANRATVADVSGTLNLYQHAADISVDTSSYVPGQENANYVQVNGGDIGGGSANILLAAADPESDYAGGGQIVTNTVNSGAFGTVGTLNAEQHAHDDANPIYQDALNELYANGGDNSGSGAITATGSRGQVAFNTINTLTGDLGAVGSGYLDQHSDYQSQDAVNIAEAYGGNIGNASITGLTQNAGSIINSIKLPTTP